MSHCYTCRVYHEDVDQGGIVYHSNYLKFAERARTEWLRTLGMDHPTLWAQERLTFVVTQLNVQYIKPARLDDLLTVTSGPFHRHGIRLSLSQQIRCAETLCVDFKVTLVLINEEGKPHRFPASLASLFSS